MGRIDLAPGLWALSAPTSRETKNSIPLRVQGLCLGHWVPTAPLLTPGPENVLLRSEEI